MDLNENQKAHIHSALKSGSFNLENEIEVLINQGFSRDIAELKINEEIDSYKQTLFEQVLKSESHEEFQKLAGFGIIVISLTGPIFHIRSLIWYVVTILIAGALGYWGYKDKPIAGVVGAICLSITLPLFYVWYVRGRNHIFNLELLIPIALATAISFLLGLITYRIIYK